MRARPSRSSARSRPVRSPPTPSPGATSRRGSSHPHERTWGVSEKPEPFAPLRATTSDPRALARAARASGLAPHDVAAVARETARLLDLLAGGPERYEALRSFLR